MIIDAKSFSDLVLLKFIGNKYKIIDSMTINQQKLNKNIFEYQSISIHLQIKSEEQRQRIIQSLQLQQIEYVINDNNLGWKYNFRQLWNNIFSSATQYCIFNGIYKFNEFKYNYLQLFDEKDNIFITHLGQDQLIKQKSDEYLIENRNKYNYSYEIQQIIKLQSYIYIDIRKICYLSNKYNNLLDKLYKILDQEYINQFKQVYIDIHHQINIYIKLQIKSINHLKTIIQKIYLNKLQLCIKYHLKQSKYCRIGSNYQIDPLISSIESCLQQYNQIWETPKQQINYNQIPTNHQRQSHNLPQLQLFQKGFLKNKKTDILTIKAYWPQLTNRLKDILSNWDIENYRRQQIDEIISILKYKLLKMRVTIQNSRVSVLQLILPDIKQIISHYERLNKGLKCDYEIIKKLKINEMYIRRQKQILIETLNQLMRQQQKKIEKLNQLMRQQQKKNEKLNQLMRQQQKKTQKFNQLKKEQQKKVIKKQQNKIYKQLLQQLRQSKSISELNKIKQVYNRLLQKKYINETFKIKINKQKQINLIKYLQQQFLVFNNILQYKRYIHLSQEIQLLYLQQIKKQYKIQQNVLDKLFNDFLLENQSIKQGKGCFYVKVDGFQKKSLKIFIGDIVGFQLKAYSWQDIFNLMTYKILGIRILSYNLDELMRLKQLNLIPNYNCLGCTQFFIINRGLYYQNYNISLKFYSNCNLEQSKQQIIKQIQFYYNNHGGIIFFGFVRQYASINPKGIYLDKQQYKLKLQSILKKLQSKQSNKIIYSFVPIVQIIKYNKNNQQQYKHIPINKCYIIRIKIIPKINKNNYRKNPLSHRCKEAAIFPQGQANFQKIYGNMSMIVVKKDFHNDIIKALHEKGIECQIQTKFQSYNFSIAKFTAVLYHNVSFQSILTNLTNNKDLKFQDKRVLAIYVTEYLRIQGKISKKDILNARLWLAKEFPLQKLRHYKLGQEDQNFVKTQSRTSLLFMYYVFNNFKVKALFKIPQPNEISQLVEINQK